MPFKFNIGIFIFLFSLAVLFSGCSKQVEYSIIPAIEFKETRILKYHNTESDSALVIVFSFVDGDGDLGLGQGDTNPPYNPKSIYYNNFYAKYYEYVDSQFIQVRPEIGGIPYGDTIRFSFRFPDLRTQTNNKALKGDIEITLSDISPVKSPTIKFDFFIYDRALHKSNMIETEPIVFHP